MNSRKIILMLSLAFILAASCNNTNTRSDAASPADKTELADKTYTCPMHPEVVSNTPGNCPKCGMKLEEVKASDKDSTMKRDTV